MLNRTHRLWIAYPNAGMDAVPPTSKRLPAMRRTRSSVPQLMSEFTIAMSSGTLPASSMMSNPSGGSSTTTGAGGGGGTSGAVGVWIGRSEEGVDGRGRGALRDAKSAAKGASGGGAGDEGSEGTGEMCEGRAKGGARVEEGSTGAAAAAGVGSGATGAGAGGGGGGRRWKVDWFIASV